ncbi:MAG TPA: diaminopimelate decarboxylase [Fimbriimonadaceae bacterium]|jgi:diaminopimelate decarboxylase
MPAACDVDTPFRLEQPTAKELAETYGTPLYVLSEASFRARIREYKQAFQNAYANSGISYASKANGTLALLKIAHQEGCHIDAASEGELRGALRAGVPASACVLHGNNKSLQEMQFGLGQGVHAIIIDNAEEIENLHSIWSTNQKTKFLLRLAPGVDPITHEKISTGKEDSKFGFNISNGAAEQALLKCLEYKLPLIGVHCHVGSQLLDPQAQMDGGQALATFAAEMSAKHGYKAEVINFGGGLGIRYTPENKPTGIKRYCEELVASVFPILEKAGLQPKLEQEPGRSLVGESGVTLYKVGVVKRVPAPNGEKTYVIVDGGLSDNPRPVMYDAVYTVEKIGGKEPMMTCTVSGKHCETDQLFPDIKLPLDTKAGDLVQVLSTGAYNSSMANNYNRFLRPATVLIQEDSSFRLVQRRETWDEMFARETP